MAIKKEIFISVDIETSGPIPGKYSMLSIGACNIYSDVERFNCELKPISMLSVPKALKISGFSLEDLKVSGKDPYLAMALFRDWIKSIVKVDERAVFVGFNASFDWSFINYYFHYFLNENPFGISALDIKSMYLGKTQGTWGDTVSTKMSNALKPESKANHNALLDAVYQAELFRLIRPIN